jgi:hypothetical protein
LGEATLRLRRIWSGVAIGGQGETWNITIDGIVAGTIAHQETVEVSVPPGHHTLRLGAGRHVSPQPSFDVSADEVVEFHCHGPRFWPQWVAAQVKPDLWITLRRS